MKGKVKGYVVSDSIALTSSLMSAARHFKFISVYESTLSTLKSDGLLGMSPSKKKGQSGVEMELLMDELVNDGAIKKKMFAIYLTDHQY